MQNTSYCFIANIDNSSLPGTHWLAFYHNKHGALEYFDSFGNDLKFYGFDKSSIVHQAICVNRRKLQSDYTSVCGYYGLLYIVLRSFGYSLQNVIAHLSKFYPNCSINDDFIMRFANQHFPIPKSHSAHCKKCCNQCNVSALSSTKLKSIVCKGCMFFPR
jgi:hypothetical protein